MIGASAPPDDTQGNLIHLDYESEPEPDPGTIPPAPYTPPPLREATASVMPYSFPSNYYLEQRITAYRQGGYDLVNYTPYQVTMTCGKSIGFFWWLLAMFSGIGLLWYFMILLTSGFSKDRVYLIIERDGTLYEDGTGAAHVRRQRAKVGRRWGFLGVVIFFLALMWFIVMIIAAVLGVNRYRAELQAAYPSVSLFASGDNPVTEVNPDAISNAESGVLAFSILFGLSLIVIVIGLLLTIVGYLHGSAYDVRVIPLPAYD
ncbi:MAG TPA: hypothetical protein VJZ27_13860 [Aggregatilineales bacterium]|nr:hypothetical protein [Aggregatilineales bacterium]